MFAPISTKTIWLARSLQDIGTPPWLIGYISRGSVEDAVLQELIRVLQANLLYLILTSGRRGSAS